MCANNTLHLLSAGNVTPLDSNMVCDTIRRARSGESLLYETRDGDTSVARFPGGQVRDLDWPPLPADDGDRYSSGTLKLSPDGSLAFRQVDRFEYCGDTVCGLAADVHVAPTDAGATSSHAVSIPQCCGHTTDAVSFADNLGRGSLVSGLDGITFYGEGSETSTLPKATPVRLYRDQRRVLTRLELDDGSLVLQLRALPGGDLISEWATNSPNPVIFSADESTFAFLTRATSSQDGRINVVRDGFLASPVAADAGGILWVGDDGAVLYDGDPPGSGDTAGDPGLHLVDAEGALLSSVTDTSLSEAILSAGVDMVAETPDALLVHASVVPADGTIPITDRLYMVPRSGETPFLLAEAHRIKLSVDDGARRLALQLYEEGDFLSRLVVGAIPSTPPATPFRSSSWP